MNIYTVSFFGHRTIDCGTEIEYRLDKLLHDLITQKEYIDFLIGRDGEFDLLAYLCEHKNTAIPKDRLLSEVWGAFSSAEPSTLTVHIRWLREKLEKDPSEPQYIKTVYKVGYMLEVKE